MKTTILSSILLFSMMSAFLSKSFAARNNIVCSGDSVKIGIDSLPSNFIGGNQSLTVRWNGTVFANDKINRNVSPASNSVYILEIIKGSNVYKDTFNVTVRSKPSIPSSVNDTTVILGDILKINLNRPGNSANTYKWNIGYLDSVLIYYPTSDTTCRLTITNNNGCSVYKDINIRVKNPIYITVNDTLKFHNAQRLNGYVKIGHATLDSLFRKHRVISIQKVKYKLNHTGRLSREFRLVFNGNEDSLMNALANLDSLIQFREISRPSLVHSSGSHAPGTHPNDWALWTTPPHALAAMRMPEAWAITHGTPGMRVGIVDIDGYPNYNHEDLLSNVSIHSTCGIPYIVKQHTTRVAGCISAIANNGKGFTGAGYNVGVTAYSVPNSIGPLQFDEVLYAAWSDGIRIVSMSLGGGGYDARTQEVIDRYYNLGVMIIASAGNGLADNVPRNSTDYPAGYNHVTSVAGAATANFTPVVFIPDVAPNPVFSSTNPDAYQVNFNNIVHGPTGQQYNATVDICAPSIKVPTTGGDDPDPVSNSAYIDAWGTSYAAPLVAAVAALIVSSNPCLEPGQIESIIKESARPISDNTVGNPWYNQLGAGFIDAKAALDLALNYYGTNALVLNPNQTVILNQVTKSYGNITVNAGALLQITDCELYMRPGTKILVKKGGRLIVVRSLITMNYKPGLCNQTSDWLGIVIEGDPTKEQSSFADHGIANLVKTTMRYSRTCVTVGGTTGGGIILASECNFTFRNYGICFIPYRSPLGLNNASKITVCTFNIPFKYPSITLPYSSMVQIGIFVNNIKGLKINGCSFISDNKVNFVGITTPYDRQAIGINSINSSLTVQDDKAVVFPAKRQTIGTFKWLDKGIYHVSTSADNNLTVNNCYFNSCGAGIKINGGSNAKIYRNIFDLDYNETGNCADLFHEVGISAYNVSGLMISENNTTQLSGSYPNGLSICRAENYIVGSVVNNTANPPKLGSIYSFNYLKNGMVSSQFEVDNSNTAVRCNIYYKHFDAITVYGVNPDFGDCNVTPNRKDRLNSFTNPYVYGDACNFNTTGKSFDYLITNWVDNPKPPTVAKFIIPSITVNLVRFCTAGSIGKIDCAKRDAPAEPGTGGVVFLGDGGKVPVLFEQLQVKKQLINNGAANALEQAVITGNSSTSMDVYNSLMLNSPYLSDAVLNAVINYANYFNASQLADILISNSALPNAIYLSALNNSILQADNNAIQSVTDAQGSISQRAVLESEIKDLTNTYYEARTAYADSLLYLHNEDTINNGNNFYVDKLIDFLESQVDEDNKYVLLPLYCSKNDIGKITSEAAKFSNNNAEEKAFKDVVLFNYDLLSGIADSVYLASKHTRILEIADDTTLYASPTANGFLDMIYGEMRYRHPFTHPEVEMGKRAMSVYELKNANTSQFSVYPNPTDGKITVTLANTLNGVKDALIKVVDLEGHEFMSTRFDANSKLKVMNLPSVKNGIYFVQIMLTDGRIYSEKIVYVK